MAQGFADFGRKLGSVTDPSSLRRITRRAGDAGKKSALDAASRDLGGDRQFSGMRRRVTLGAGYDLGAGTEVTVNFRPAGLWRLADQGRRGTKPILPRRGRRAVLTPHGPRARSTSKPSRGLGTYQDAVKDAHRSVPKAAHAALVAELRRMF